MLLQPNIVDLRYFKLGTLLGQKSKFETLGCIDKGITLGCIDKGITLGCIDKGITQFETAGKAQFLQVFES